MINLEDQNKLFEFIGEKLKKKIECYIIGGSAMMYSGFKDTTKDIDLVFESENDRSIIEKLLKDLGYKERDVKVLYFRKKNTPILLQRDDVRFDLFLRMIISTELSDNMKSRMKEVYEYGNFVVKVLAPEDLIITKCATERAGDRKDVAEIIKKFKINWDIIVDESIHQAEATPYVFPVFLYDFLCELRDDLKVEIPEKIIDKIMKISENLMVKKLKKKK